MVGGHGQVKSRHVDSYSFFFFVVVIVFFQSSSFSSTLIYYYKIMIMTFMIMKTIMIVFNLKQNAHPKRKCAYSFVHC